MKNETIELLYNRKSVRAYEKREIPEEDVQKILRAAIEAPTAGNMTLWSAIRVTDEAKKKRLSETCDNQPFIASAPLVLVFCADYKRWYDLFATLDLGEELRKPGEGDLMLAMMDTIIAAHASVVAADALGCGSCYIGDIIERCEQQREILGPAGVRQAGLHGGLRHSARSFKRRARSPRALKRMISYLKTNISRAIPNRCGACSKTVRISMAKSWNAGSRRTASANGIAIFLAR